MTQDQIDKVKVVKNADQPQCSPGGLCSFTYTITNTGTTPTSFPITFIGTMPAGAASYVSATPLPWGCLPFGAGQIKCLYPPPIGGGPSDPGGRLHLGHSDLSNNPRHQPNDRGELCRFLHRTALIGDAAAAATRRRQNGCECASRLSADARHRRSQLHPPGAGPRRPQLRDGQYRDAAKSPRHRCRNRQDRRHQPSAASQRLRLPYRRDQCRRAILRHERHHCHRRGPGRHDIQRCNRTELELRRVAGFRRSTITCTYTGPGPTAPNQNLGTIDVVATALGSSPYPPFTNCATVAVLPTSGQQDTNASNDNACVTVTKPPQMLCAPPKVAGPVPGSCACPPNTLTRGQECITQTVCAPPKVVGPVPGVCICPPGTVARGQECVTQTICKPPMVPGAAPGVCACPQGTVKKGSRCTEPVVCRAPAKLNRRGVCECPADMVARGKECIPRERRQPGLPDGIRNIPGGFGPGGGGRREGGGGREARVAVVSATEQAVEVRSTAPPPLGPRLN